LSKEFNEEITDMVNPYDRYQDGKTSHKIKEKLKEITLNDGVLKKEFYDYNIDY
jgi:UDP-N-acetylglucosamine 2-epimerase (non-hydrolysing)/GDP/UDP-N,N'-diacetylbacillosamine 2-epimerase (hydrolysing)